MEVVNIVVARYKRDVEFAYKFNDGKNINVLVYDKENSENPYNVPVNKGNEASVYLKHIIDFYDNLSEFTLFIHDEEFAWHHNGSLIDRYNDAKEFCIINKKSQFMSLNSCCQWKPGDEMATDLWNDLLEWYKEHIEYIIPFSKIPHNSRFDVLTDHYGGSQFLLHKDLIRLLPKEFYEKIYNWLITTDVPNWKSGRYLEWTWHIFWTIYPKLKN